MANIKSIINMRNKDVITGKKTEAVKRNWQIKNLNASLPTNAKLRT